MATKPKSPPKGTPMPEVTTPNPAAGQETKAADDVGQESKPAGAGEPSGEQANESVITSGGTEVGDASADVGQVAAPVVSAAADFAQAVAARDMTQRLTQLMLVGYSQELIDGVLKVLDDEETTVATKALLTDVLCYATEMGPSCPVMGGAGLRHQQNFFNGFTNYVNFGPADFRVGMNVLLAIIAESIAMGTGFSEHLPMRFLPNVALSSEKVKGLERLMHLLLATADASTRSLALRQIALEEAVRYGLSSDGRDRLIAFYAV